MFGLAAVLQTNNLAHYWSGGYNTTDGHGLLAGVQRARTSAVESREGLVANAFARLAKQEERKGSVLTQKVWDSPIIVLCVDPAVGSQEGVAVANAFVRLARGKRT